MNWRVFASALLLAVGLAACSSEDETGDPILLCEEGQQACGGACADTSTDPRHCGACDNACGAGMVCSDGACATVCPADQVACDGGCYDPQTSADHCGTCGNACDGLDACVDGACVAACPVGQEICGDGCFDLGTSNQHCGTCDKACGAGEICLDGDCTTDCPLGQTACDGGCHDLQGSTLHCGACGNACDAGEACVDGTCGSNCAAGTTDCDGTCRNLNTDRANCGACGTTCGDAEICVDGSCELVCGSGLTECSGACRDTDVDAANCGACNNACAGDQICVDGACTAFCGAFDSTLCDGSCTNTDFDPNNCGGCGNACAAGELCSDGVCTGVCGPEHATCGDACTSLDNDPANCGACGTACTGAPNGAAICNDGGCGVLCMPGFGDCNLDLVSSGTDGCEIHLDTNLANCGVCGNACPTPANATASCVAGSCGIGVCEPGYFDCDLDPANGCESQVTSDAANCGACGITCGSGQACENSVCVDVPGESCGTPWPLVVGTNVVNWAATTQDHITSTPSCGSSYAPNGPDVIFSYTASVTGKVFVRLDKPASQRYHMLAWDGLCGDTANQIACMSEFTATTMEVAFDVVAGLTYFVGVVDTTSGTSPLPNPLELTVTEIDLANLPPGDVCTDPIVLTAGNQQIFWTALGLDYVTATPSCGSGYTPTGPDLVFQYTPTFSGSVDVSIAKPANNRWHLLVGTGTCGDVTSPLACVSEYTAAAIGGSLNVTAGTTYFMYLVDTTSGSALLSNPLDITISENDCSVSPTVTVTPAPGGTAARLAPTFEVRASRKFTKNVGTITITGNMGTSKTITLPSSDVTYSADSLVMYIGNTTFQPGEVATITWSGITDEVCSAAINPPASWTVTIPVPTCSPGMNGAVGTTITRSSLGFVGSAPSEFYMAVDQDPNGWVYLGGTGFLYRRPKAGGPAQNVYADAGLTTSHLGYSMVIDGPNIYTFDETSSTTASTNRVFRISSDGGQTWNVENAATFTVAPNDDLRSAAAFGGRIFAITEEFSAGTELWSFDPSGGLPAPATLEVTFGGADYQYCEGLAVDAAYAYTTCRLLRDTTKWAIIRADRTTGAVTELSTAFPGNITAMAIHVKDTNGDGIADVVYSKGDREEGYFICDPHTAPYDVLHYSYGTGTGNYGLAFDPVANVLWAFDDDTLELLKIE